MISAEAKKIKNKYSKLGSLISMLATNPNKVSKIKVRLQRLNFDMIVKLNPKAKGSEYEEVSLNGIRTWKITTPNSDPEKILLYFHGGAYQVGSPEGYYPMISHMAENTGFTIYLPDYKLAPEHYFPSQLENGLKSYEALVNDFGYSPDQIAVGGDSAGGNLTLVTLLKLKELGRKLPSAAFCISPWADPAATGESYNNEMLKKDVLMGPVFKKIWNNFDLDGFSRYYVLDEDMDKMNPYICPIYGDFKDFPPVMIQVGGHELLLSDSQTLKKAFERDEVVHEYKEWDELWHVFQIEATMPESTESFRMFGNFLNKYIGVSV